MDNPDSLYDLLACPNCKVHVDRIDEKLVCSSCGVTYPIVDGIPVMFPDGSIPSIQHEGELSVRTTYDPWVHRLIMQSLLDNQIVVEIGSGNMAIDDPCIIRMDVTISPYVDLVADVHYLPFLPESVDYIFSLAVFEHLYNPFKAAKSIFDSLKDGGFIYHECNFIFAYHGYPHHYFNASLQGMEQIFSDFSPLRKGVAPYQMPSFALDMLVRSYLHHSQADNFDHGKKLTSQLQNLIAQDLILYDIYFSEEAALNVAAGTFFSGFKQKTPTSTLIPTAILDIWNKNIEIQERFPQINQLTVSDNILLWAKDEGKNQYTELQKFFDSLQPFNKRGPESLWNRDAIKSMPVFDAYFGAVGFDPKNSMEVNSSLAEKRELQAEISFPADEQAPQVDNSPAEKQELQTNNSSTVDEQNPSENEELVDPPGLIIRGLTSLIREGPLTFLRKIFNYILR